MNIKQLIGDRVLIKQDEQLKEINGIIIPDKYQEKPSTGEVLMVGPDVEEIKPGDYVVYPFNVKDFYKWNENGENYIIIHSFDISCIVTE